MYGPGGRGGHGESTKATIHPGRPLEAENEPDESAIKMQCPSSEPPPAHETIKLPGGAT